MPSPLRKLAGSIPAGRYEVPRLLKTEILLLEGETRPQLLLVLEGGYELALPMSPDATGEFFQAQRLLNRDDT